MFHEFSVAHTLAYALKRGGFPRGALNLGYLTTTEQADFHAKCDEIDVPTSEQVIAELKAQGRLPTAPIPTIQAPVFIDGEDRSSEAA